MAILRRFKEGDRVYYVHPRRPPKPNEPVYRGTVVRLDPDDPEITEVLWDHNEDNQTTRNYTERLRYSTDEGRKGDV